MSVVPLPATLSTQLADLAPNPLVVLGQDRRIRYANRAARLLGTRPENVGIEGSRLGDILRCVHSSEDGGCGTTPECASCGANQTIHYALAGTAHAQTCRLTSRTEEGESTQEFTMHSHPVEWDGEPAVFCALNDTSNEKRRRALDRYFFHDILNTAGSVKGLSEVLLMQRRDLTHEELGDLLAMMRDSCSVLLDEIRSHQLLLAAEGGQLEVNWTQVSVADCVAEAVMVARNWPLSTRKNIVPEYPNGRIRFKTDPVLLGRVLRNLLKNALEATGQGEEVHLSCKAVGDRLEFCVWNAGVIPEWAQVRIFKQSFSTKETGRGIGTYSVRLFTEDFLKGKVSFTSSESDGTSFRVSIPL